MESRLAAPDPDIRFMALKDLLTSAQGASIRTPILKSHQVAVIECLRDSSPDVRGLAVRAAGAIAGSDPTSVLQMVFDAECAEKTRGAALNAVLTAALDADPLLTFSKLISKRASKQLLNTQEGLNALSVYASRALDANLLLPLLLPIVETGNALPYTWDVLAQVLACSPNDEQFALVAAGIASLETSVPMLNMLSRVAESGVYVPTELVERCVSKAQSDDFDDFELIDASLRALASIVGRRGCDWVNKMSVDLTSIALNALGMNDGQESDMFDDPDFVDDQCGMRQAGAVLASALFTAQSHSVKGIQSALVECAQNEQDESAKAVYYTSLAKSDLTEYLPTLQQLVLGDIQHSRRLAAHAGVAMLVQVPNSFLDVCKQAITRWPSSTQLVLELHHVCEAHQQFIRASVELKKDVENCIDTVFMHAVPDSDTSLTVIKIIELLDLARFPVGALLRESTSEAVQVAALNTLSKLSLDRFQWQTAVDSSLVLLKRSPVLRVPALAVLEQALKHHIQDASGIIAGVSEILQVDKSADVVSSCIAVLQAAPLNADVVTAVVHVDNDAGLEGKEVEALLQKAGANPASFSWAIRHRALKLLASMSCEELSAQALAQRPNDPEVHAAASVKCLEKLSYYQLPTTPFASLTTDQLAVLRVLTDYVVPPWLSVKEMARECVTCEQAAVLGNVLRATNDKLFANIIERLPTASAREAAFTHYCINHNNYHLLLNTVTDHPMLKLTGLSNALKTTKSVEDFTTQFSGEPKFLVSVLQSLDVKLLAPALPCLQTIACTHSIELEIRVGAISTLRWALLAKASDSTGDKPLREPLRELARAMLPLIIPDVSRISVVNIGPFKHKVDSELPIREEAISSLVAVATRSKIAFHDVLDQVIKHSLDDEISVRSGAYKLISLWSSTPQVQELKDVILEATTRIVEPKPNAKKIEVERYAELMGAVAVVKEKLGQ